MVNEHATEKESGEMLEEKKIDLLKPSWDHLSSK
jgi:hypothetical protein